MLFLLADDYLIVETFMKNKGDRMCNGGFSECDLIRVMEA